MLFHMEDFVPFLHVLLSMVNLTILCLEAKDINEKNLIQILLIVKVILHILVMKLMHFHFMRCIEVTAILSLKICINPVIFFWDFYLYRDKN